MHSRVPSANGPSGSQSEIDNNPRLSGSVSSVLSQAPAVYPEGATASGHPLASYHLSYPACWVAPFGRVTYPSFPRNSGVWVGGIKKQHPSTWRLLH